MNDKLDNAADIGTAASIVLFGLTLPEWHEIVQIFAGCSAVFAGTMAGLYHYRRARLLKKTERADDVPPE